MRGHSGEVVAFFRGDMESALTRRPSASHYMATEGDSTGFYVNRVLYYRCLGDDRYKEFADIAIPLLEEQIRQNPDSEGAYGSLAVVNACLGNREEAVGYAKKATEIMPVSRDAVSGTDVRGNMMLVYAILKDRELVLEELEYLLSVPAYVTRATARMDPTLKFLHNDPRFQQLVQEPRP